MASIIDQVTKYGEDLIQYATDYWPVALFGVFAIGIYILYKIAGG